MPDRTAIKEMFARARASYRWTIDDTCRWSFFFRGHDRQTLISAAGELASAGYVFVGLLEPAEADDDHQLLFARLDRVEVHSIDSLIQRNLALDEFVRKFAGVTYDGMEVGPPDGVG